MALSRPTPRIPVWSSGGTNTDPGTGKEASGWAISEKPPAYWFNWILNSLGQWVDFLGSDRPIITYSAFLEVGGTPQVLWEKGDTATITDPGSPGPVYIDLTNARSTTDSVLLVTDTRQASTDNIVLKAAWGGTTRVVLIGTQADTGSGVDLNAVGPSSLDRRVYLTIIE